MAPTTTKTDAPAEGPLPTAILDKYKAAAQVVSTTLQAIIAKAVDGANIIELQIEGDKLIEQGTASLYNKVKGIPKGVAFPTTISVNSDIQNANVLPSDKVSKATLAADDIVKICVGAHIDGYPIVAAETVVITSSPVTDIKATLITAAHQAAEAAIRAVKPGSKNWEVTAAIKQVLDEYESAGVKGVEGVLSHQHEQNSIEAKKGIVAVPTHSQRSDSDNSFTFEEGEVYGLNINVTNGEKTFKTADGSRTTIYQKTPTTYALKLKTSRAVFTEISKKAGGFPFTLRVLEDETKSRAGIRECTQHQILKPYEVITTDKLSAQAFLTFTVTKTGAARLSLAPTYFSEERVKSDVAISDALKATLAKPLKAKPAKKKAAKVEGEKAE